MVNVVIERFSLNETHASSARRLDAARNWIKQNNSTIMEMGE
jgi:hypothetical protein